MINGTYGYELRRPIYEALRLIQDYINSEVLVIDCTVNEYSVWESNLRIMPSYYYFVEDGYPRHISQDHTLNICNVISDIYYNNIVPECIITHSAFMFMKHAYSEFMITIIELDADHEPTDVTYQAFNMLEAANAIRNSEADCYMYVGSCSGMSTIVEEEFEGLTNLYDVRLPKSIRNVGEDAFAGTTWLERKRARQNNLVSVNDILIDGKAASGNIEILPHITIICNGAFKNNTNITAVKLPTYLKLIDREAFYGTTGLTSISFPDLLDTIGTSAFEGSGLTELYIPGNVTSINSGAFRSCLFLEYVEICTGTTIVNGLAFGYCEALETVKLPKSINYIGFDCFIRDVGGIHQYIEINKPQDSLDGAPWGAINYTLTWR